MRGGNVHESRHVLTWLRGSAFFITFGLLSLFIVVALLEISLQQQNALTNNSVSIVNFVVRKVTGNQTFTVGVGVNLSDGMDEDEAVKVATKVYERSNMYERQLGQLPPDYITLSTTHMSEDGTWKVEFHMVSLTAFYCSRNFMYSRIQREYFWAVINPSNNAVEYATEQKRQ